MTNTNTPGRASRWIGGVAIALSLILVGVIVFLGLTASEAFDEPQGPLDTSCAFYYDALDPNDSTKSNPLKIQDGDWVPGAVGTPVLARDEAGIKAELNQRRTCGDDGKEDPSLVSQHYADWSNATTDGTLTGPPANLTKIKVAYAEIDAFTARLIAEPDLYAAVIAELAEFEGPSAFSIDENIAIGVWSIYVAPDGLGGVITMIGKTSHVGTAAVFTHPSGAIVKYRLECGFQILHETPPPGLPECDESCYPHKDHTTGVTRTWDEDRPVNYNDGAIDSQGVQHNPEADAAAAKAKAEAEAAAAKAIADAAAAAAAEGSDDQEQGDAGDQDAQIDWDG